MTTAFSAGIVASDCWKAGLTFISSADPQPLIPRICHPSTRLPAALVAITEAYGDFLGCCYALKSLGQFLMLFANLLRQALAEFSKKLFRIFQLQLPIFRIHAQQFVHRTL